MTEFLWRQIMNALSDDITDGRYPPGGRLPSEAALSSRFGVNRHTVRRALQAMQERGLVQARRGSGVFVTGTHVSYRLGRRTRFSQNLAETGHESSRRILRLETLPGDGIETGALALPAGALVHVVESIALADEVPILYGRRVFPADPLPGFLSAMERLKTITGALAECGVADYRRQSTRLVAERASGTVARQLLVAEGAPVLRTVAVGVEPGGTPVEYGMTWFAADRVELVVDEKSFP